MTDRGAVGMAGVVSGLTRGIVGCAQDVQCGLQPLDEAQTAADALLAQRWVAAQQHLLGATAERAAAVLVLPGSLWGATDHSRVSVKRSGQSGHVFTRICAHRVWPWPCWQVND